jgi:hypothetical protein
MYLFNPFVLPEINNPLWRVFTGYLHFEQLSNMHILLKECHLSLFRHLLALGSFSWCQENDSYLFLQHYCTHLKLSELLFQNSPTYYIQIILVIHVHSNTQYLQKSLVLRWGLLRYASWSPGGGASKQ